MDYKQQQQPRAKGKKAPKRRAQQRIRNDAPQGTAASVTQSGFVIKPMPMFGYRIRKKLNYWTSGTITSGASTANSYVFSANGLFDPDVTGTGGQPMSFDQMMTFFNHYTVHNATIRVIFMTNTAILRASVGLFVSGSSTTTTSIEQLLENGDGAIQVLAYAGQFGGTATLSRYLDAARFQTVTDVMDDPNMRGDSASNPAEQAYFHLIVYNPASSATVSVDFQVIIEYDATFHEPRKGSLS